GAGYPPAGTASMLRLEPRHLPRVGGIGDIDHGQPAVRAAEPDDTGAPALLAGGEDLVADEHVAPVAPARVGATDEAGPASELHLLVELVQVVLVLQPQPRISRPA